MAGYGHNTYGHSTYNRPSSEYGHFTYTKPSSEYGHTTYTTPSDWSAKPSYSSSDHVCRPVIVDAEGRKRPIVSYETNPNTAYYTTKTETVVQHHTISPQYKHGVHWSEEGYGSVEDKYRKPLTSYNGRPPIVDEFLTKVQNEASRPNAGHWNNGASWRQTGNTGGYNEYNDHLGNKEFLKSSGNTYGNDTFDDYYRKQDSTMGPHMVTSGGWARPTHSTWASPIDSSLSEPTTDIGKAVGLLKEAIKPSHAYAGSIDSKEAAKRYGKFNFASRPVVVEDYAPTIDSREAARKYGGRAV